MKVFKKAIILSFTLFTLISVNSLAQSGNQQIILGKQKIGQPVTPYLGDGKTLATKHKVLAFKVGTESHKPWHPVDPFGKEIMPYMEKDETAWKYFLKYRTNARIAYGGNGVMMIGGLYTGIQLIKSDGELTTQQGIIGLSIFGAGLGLHIGMNAAAKSNIYKAVEHYNEAIGMMRLEENKEEGICWVIQGSSFSAGVSLVGRF